MRMLDLSKFEKVKEDKDTTTMRHKDGHEMTILIAKLPKIHREQLKRLKMAEGGVAKYEDGSKDNPVSQDDVSANQPMSEKIPVNANPAAQEAFAPVTVNTPAVPASAQNLGPTGTMNPAAVAQNTQAAAQLQGDVNAAKAKSMVPLEQAYITAATNTAKQDQENLNNIKSHVDSFNQYIQEHPIDEKHYIENMGAGQKITMALGLLAGGFTGGFNGSGNNPALNYLNQQIDRDIDAQKSRMDQQRTLYGAYHQIYGDSVAANAATKASMLDIYTHKMNKIAAELGTPQAKAAAMAFAANAAVEKGKQFQEGAVDLRNVPGTIPVNQSVNPQSLKQPELQGAGTSASWSPDSILIPNSEQAFKGLAYTPKAKEDLPAIQHQYSQAIQADKSLAQLDDVFSKLQKNEEEGSVGGNVRRRGVGAVEGLPLGIGSSLAGGLKYLTDTPANILYDANQKALIGMISSALKGTNIGGDQIHDIVMANSPERGDSPKTILQKKQNIKDFIKNHTETSLLKTWGLAN